MGESNLNYKFLASVQNESNRLKRLKIGLKPIM